MAEKVENVVAPGEEVTTPTSTMPLKPEDQFRLLHQQVVALTQQVNALAKPPTFRVADTVNLVAIVLGVALVGLSAFGLADRIADIRADLAAAETRGKDTATAMEGRLTTRLEKLSDQVLSMSDRTSRLEGAVNATSGGLNKRSE